MNYRGCYAEINLTQLRSNFRSLREAVGASKFICPMLKADAYGHGDVQVARALEQESAASFGVSLVEEGLKLRQAGIHSQILVFGISNEQGHRAALEHRLTPVVSSLWQLDLLSNLIKQETAIHLKIDTGMNRLGLHLAEIQKAKQILSSNRNIKLEGLLTHLYRSEDTPNAKGDTQKQLSRFQDTVKELSSPQAKLHALNSGAILKKNQLSPGHFIHELGARPGLLLYGASPFANEEAPSSFKSVMSLRSSILRYLPVAKGETVSYNGTWRAQKDSLVAVVAAGYADGFHRIVSNKAQVLFRGQRVPVIGNVCMDFFLIDLTDLSAKENLQVFEEVTLFGRDRSGIALPIEELACHASTISWEMMTSVSSRVPRIYQ